MQCGISTASLFLKRDNREAIELFGEWNIPVAEVFLTSFSEYNRAFGKELAARKGGVVVNSVHDLTEQFEPQLYSVHPKVQADAFAVLKGVMEVAQTLGAKYYTFHGVSRLKRSGRYDRYDYYAEQTEKIAAFCREYGVTLAYETVEWALYNQPGVFKKLKAGCPSLKGVLDVKQARISGYDYGRYIEEMGSDLAYVHFSDVDERGNTCLCGRGLFDVEELVKRLQGVGFDGAILMEHYAGEYRELAELKRAYEYLKEKIYKLTV